MRAAFARRRTRMVNGLRSIPGVKCRMPEGAFYVFPNVEGLIGKSYKGTKITGSVQLSEILLADFKVAAVPGAPFGAEGYLRMSFVTSKANLEKGLARIRELAASLS